MKISWKHRKPLVSDKNIPVVMVRNIIPDHDRIVDSYIMAPPMRAAGSTTTQTIQLRMNSRLEMTEGEFPQTPIPFKTRKKEYSEGEIGVSSFDFKSLKQSKYIDHYDFYKLGFCTQADKKAIRFGPRFIYMDKGTIPSYLVYMFGYIPAGTRYFEITPSDTFFPDVKRYVSEKIIYLSIDEHKSITELTGYNELMQYIN